VGITPPQVVSVEHEGFRSRGSANPTSKAVITAPLSVHGVLGGPGVPSSFRKHAFFVGADQEFKGCDFEPNLFALLGIGNGAWMIELNQILDCRDNVGTARDYFLGRLEMMMPGEGSAA
jgi:hypothetical protein